MGLYQSTDVYMFCVNKIFGLNDYFWANFKGVFINFISKSDLLKYFGLKAYFCLHCVVVAVLAPISIISCIEPGGGVTVAATYQKFIFFT